MIKLYFFTIICFSIFGCNSCDSKSPTESVIIAGCIDSLACNFDSNATVDNGSCEYNSCEENQDLVDECNYPINSLWLIDNGAGVYDVGYWSTEDIGGFQFNVDGTTINNASGGDASTAGFVVSAGLQTVLGFSLAGTTIIAGDPSVLLTLDLASIPTGLSGITISDTDADNLDFVFSNNCFYVNLSQTSLNHLIILEDTISSLEIGDEIGIFDENGIINYNNCEPEYGKILVGAGVWTGIQLNLYGIGSVNLCDNNGIIKPGYNPGNLIQLKVWDKSEQIVKDAVYTLSEGNNTFAPLFTVINELSF